MDLDTLRGPCLAIALAKAEAYRRMVGARFLSKHPKLLVELESGNLSFVALIELSKCSGSDNLADIIAKCRGGSLEQVVEIVSNEIAPTVPKKAYESVRKIRVKPK